MEAVTGDRQAWKPATFNEALAAYLAAYYRLLGSVARMLRFRSMAEAFVMLSQSTDPRPSGKP